MFQHLRTATTLLLAFTVLTGLVYPCVVTTIAQVVFPHQANGSIIRSGELSVGSELIGQAFSQPEYFCGRLSATGPFAYNASASSGSNYGPLNPAVAESANARIAALHQHSLPTHAVPVDLVTASASGLDPHITPAAAEFQVPRIAASRKITEDRVRELVQVYTEFRQFGVLGEPRVNVLRLNLALDQQRKSE